MALPLLAALISTLAIAGSSSAQDLPAQVGPRTNLPIVNKIIAPDGFSRSTVLVGGRFPAPLITATKGTNSEFALNVQDQLHDPTMNQTTSIHWHGILQRGGTNWADGPAFVNQCPIAPGHSFLYQFNSFDQTGTYWYHSHEGLQYCDGLRGPLVIYDPNDPHKHLYDVDDESTVITLADWYHTVSRDTPIPFVADSTLINGKGRYHNGPLVDLAVINVEYGKRYRFRLVSTSCDPQYNFTIDAHPMTVIEADGENTVALEGINTINILAGQRYSFVVNANQPVDNYWIRAHPNNNKDTTFTNGQNSAILRYKGAKAVEPSQNHTTPGKFLLETDLHALENAAVPPPDIVIPLEFSFNTTSGLFLVNGTSFIPPKYPVLLQILSGARTAQEIAPPGSIITVPRNKIIELVMPAAAVAPFGGPHPIHLHGHAFSVVRSAGSDRVNTQTPVRRDVVSIGTGANDSVTIRFKTDNPGPWFLHCHIDPHLNAGFAVVFAEDTQDTPLLDYPPPAWNDLCPIYYKLPESKL